jgi:hypothetical protein
VRLAATLLLLLPVLSAAAPADVADLFPADVLGYAEVGRPAETAKDVAAFLKGTRFDPAKGQPRRGGSRPDAEFAGGNPLSRLLSLEMFREAGKFQGAAVALTGFDRSGNAEYLFILLPGTSKLPDEILRSHLASSPNPRKIAKVEGIDLYQGRPTVPFDGPLILPPQGAPGQTEASEPSAVGPVYAHTPGIVLVGSKKDLVAAAIRRWKGKETSAALSAEPRFKEASDQRAKPGIFVFADAKRLLALAIAAEAETSFARHLLKKLLPVAGTRTFTARIELTGEGLEIHGALKLDTKAPGALAELLSTPPLSASELIAPANDAPLTFRLNLPAEQRVSRLTTILDGFVTATGTLGPTAGEIVADLEARKVLDAKHLAAIERLAVVLPPPPAKGKTVPTLPTVLLHTATSEAPEAIEAALPALFELLGGGRADSVMETIDGVRVRSFEARATPLGVPVHFGRRGKVCGLGFDRKLLAASLKSETAITGEVADWLKKTGGAPAVGAWTWAESLRTLNPEALLARQRPLWTPSDLRLEIDGPVGYPVSPYGPPLAAADLLDDLRGLPPALVSFGRKGDELRFELRQRDPKGTRVKAIDRGLDWYQRWLSTEYIPGSVVPIEDVPLIVPPPIPVLPPP